MVALWAREEADRQRALDRLPEGRTARPAGSWTQFCRLYPEAGCAVVVAPDPDPELFARLQTLKQHHPGRPLILVTRRDPSTLRLLKDVIVEEVVWTDARGQELEEALHRADAEQWFHRQEERLAAANGLPPTLTAALTRALRRRPPLTSVQAMAREVDRDRRTLWHHWRNVVGDDEAFTLKGFLDWILLLRAIAWKTESRSWHEVAADLGVHARTLRRVSQRQFGRSLQEIDGGDRERFFTAFEQEVMEPLLAGRGP